jgi:hypothetical protein
MKRTMLDSFRTDRNTAFMLVKLYVVAYMLYIGFCAGGLFWIGIGVQILWGIFTAALIVFWIGVELTSLSHMDFSVKKAVRSMSTAIAAGATIALIMLIFRQSIAIYTAMMTELYLYVGILGIFFFTSSPKVKRL